MTHKIITSPVGAKAQVTLPKVVREALHLKAIEKFQQAIEGRQWPSGLAILRSLGHLRGEGLWCR